MVSLQTDIEKNNLILPSESSELQIPKCMNLESSNNLNILSCISTETDECSNLFGSNFTNQIYLLPNLIRNSITKKQIDISVNKKSSKDFLHVNEAIELILKIIKKGKHRLCNVASGKNIKLSTISEKIKKITDCKINYKNQNKLVNEPKININRIKR